MNVAPLAEVEHQEVAFGLGGFGAFADTGAVVVDVLGVVDGDEVDGTVGFDHLGESLTGHISVGEQLSTNDIAGLDVAFVVYADK